MRSLNQRQIRGCLYAVEHNFGACGGEVEVANDEVRWKLGEYALGAHPNCSASVVSNCFPANLQYNGDLLQIMPWPLLRSMTEHEMRAIYEYLSAIPCIAGPATGVLHNDCT
jgi:hypothetical protein